MQTRNIQQKMKGVIVLTAMLVALLGLLVGINVPARGDVRVWHARTIRTNKVIWGTSVRSTKVIWGSSSSEVDMSSRVKDGKD